jgi:hypothetical protein
MLGIQVNRELKLVISLLAEHGDLPLAVGWQPQWDSF